MGGETQRNKGITGNLCQDPLYTEEKGSKAERAKESNCGINYRTIASPHTSTMSDKRRAEILAKRAKLEEMRKAKAQRQAEAERRTSLVRSAALPLTPG